MSDSTRRGDNVVNMMPSDPELLQRYLAGGPPAQLAFAELVERHVGLVYSVARRHLASPALADEVTQSVFIDLARQARRISARTPLIAWLHVVSRRTAIDVMRREFRRRAREQAAAALADMNPLPSPWAAIEPLLDEAVEALPAPDRTAILLRFFEQKSLREVGVALGASEDAAQKRVTRALEQLRHLLSRRGVAVTAAGLAADLSAHALRHAPAGLGSTILATTAQLVPAAATVSIFTSLAMTTFQKIGLAAGVAVSAVVVYETTVLRRQTRELDRLEAEQQATSTELAALHTARSATADRLARLRAQRESRVALADTPGSANDAALTAQMNAWYAQVDQLRHFIAEDPRHAIPELQFLTHDDWFSAATDNSLTNETDLRKAASSLRRRGEMVFSSRLHQALIAYVKAHDNELPGTPQDLLPHFDPPIDAHLLDRYEVLHRGRASDVPSDARTRVVAPRTPVDVEHDMYFSAGVGGYGNTSAMSYNLTVAEREFRKAHPGREPAAAVELLPYLKWPVDAGVVQQMLERRRVALQKGGAR